jgi:hypothetical protein
LSRLMKAFCLNCVALSAMASCATLANACSSIPSAITVSPAPSTSTDGTRPSSLSLSLSPLCRVNVGARVVNECLKG